MTRLGANVRRSSFAGLDAGHHSVEFALDPLEGVVLPHEPLERSREGELLANLKPKLTHKFLSGLRNGGRDNFEHKQARTAIHGAHEKWAIVYTEIKVGQAPIFVRAVWKAES